MEFLVEFIDMPPTGTRVQKIYTAKTPRQARAEAWSQLTDDEKDELLKRRTRVWVMVDHRDVVEEAQRGDRQGLQEARSADHSAGYQVKQGRDATTTAPSA